MNGNKVKIAVASGLVVLALVVLMAAPTSAKAAATSNENPNTSNFQLVSCDGPAGVATGTRICDFQGAITQIQHLMNVMIMLGVLAAIILFAYAGYLYTSVSFTGKQENIKKAHEIFQKVAIGFIIMLVAWFVVYQILAWLVGSSSPAVAFFNKS